MGNRDSDSTAPRSATPHTNATSSANAPPITRATPLSTSIERPHGAYDHLGFIRMENEARTRYKEGVMTRAEGLLRTRVDSIIQDLVDLRQIDGLAIRQAFLEQTAALGLLPTPEWIVESHRQVAEGTRTGASIIPRVKPVPQLPVPGPQPPPTEPPNSPPRSPSSQHGGSHATLIGEGGPDNAEQNDGVPAEEKNAKRAKKAEKRRRQKERKKEKRATADGGVYLQAEEMD
ncbi:hypothetical protein J4E93_008659 [Alternaria ventricosa]|uniref:uncharacterized protein n=1 Tax=Alternaria ventricosa TaxID=1187951 RepID=UPI0020C1FE67|nr:uncharacterized protein J4E93_008659 [Alternaria ventricosa]KAI4640453.1 hypothetical protein J4E93_008659 [Alternaria ventricosa]